MRKDLEAYLKNPWKWTDSYKIEWWNPMMVNCYDVSAEEYNKQLKHCIDNGYVHNKKWYYESKVSYFTKCQYQWKEFPTGMCLCYVDNDYNYHRYWWSKNGQQCDLGVYIKKENDGRAVYNIWANKFRELNNIRLTQAFSDTNLGELPQLIKKCVPRDIRYANTAAVKNKMVLSSIYKADVSSAYPYNLCGSLPTLKGFKRCEGYEKPDREYPFAFYLNSKHMAIYGELDSRDWSDNIYYDHSYRAKEYNEYIDDKDEITILCKASDYKLDRIVNEFYDLKKTDDSYKLILNVFIGYLNRDTSTLNHITAVVKARLVNQMIHYCKKLRNEGNKIMWIGVDSIAWQGKESDIAVNNKFLGGFIYEHKNVEMLIRAYTAYQIKDGDKIITKCSNLAKDDPRRDEWKSLLAIDEGQFMPKKIKVTKEGYLMIF